MTEPVCFITGVGDGTGAALARRFADGGYRVAMLARNRERLEALENEIADAKAYACDIADLEALLATVDAVRSKMGAPSVLVHNAVSATFKTFLDANFLRIPPLGWPRSLSRERSFIARGRE